MRPRPVAVCVDAKQYHWLVVMVAGIEFANEFF